MPGKIRNVPWVVKARWLAVDKNENVSLKLKQPGGEIGVEARYKDESMESLMINGKVKLVSSHMMDIDL